VVANDLAQVGRQDIDIDTGAPHGKSDAEADPFTTSSCSSSEPVKPSFHFHNFNPERIPQSSADAVPSEGPFIPCTLHALFAFENVFVESGGPEQTRLCPQVADVVCATVFQRNQVVHFYVDLVA
jgi:hypothetical protein